MTRRIILAWLSVLLVIPVSAKPTPSDEPWVDQSPHKSDFVTVNGIKLHYLDWSGTGEPLLFLTALNSNAHTFDDIAPKFTDHFRVLALTRRGHGLSDKPETGYNTDTLVEDIRQFLDTLRIDRVTLVGFSFAGDELTRFAGLYPTRVEKLVYLDAAYDKTRRPELMAKDPFPQPSPDYSSPDAYRTWWTKVWGFWSPAMEAHLPDRLVRRSDGTVELRMPANVSQALLKGMEAYRPDYAKVTAPALAIYTIQSIAIRYPWLMSNMNETDRKKVQQYLDDVANPWVREQMERFRKEVVNGRVVEMPNTNHFCFITRQDDVVREVRAFLLGK